MQRISRAARAQVERLESRWLFVAVAWDAGGDGFNWTDPLNWSDDAVPTSDNDVTISILANPTIQINSGFQFAKTLLSDEAIQLSGGTLSLGGASTLNAAFTFTSGTLQGAGGLAVNGNMSWQGGTMEGTGKTVIAASSTSSIDVSGFPILGRLMEVSGTANLINSGSALYFGSAGTPGVLTVLSGGNVNIAGGGGMTLNFAGANAVNVQTGGTLTKTGAAGSMAIGIPVNLVGGTIGATSGVLNLNDGGTSTGGAFTTTTPGIVAFNGGTHNLSGTYAVSGTGEIQVTGSATIDVATTATLGSMVMTSGTIQGAGILNLTGFTWRGGIMQGAGKTVLGSGAASSIDVSGTPVLGRLMEVSGTVNMINSGGALYFGSGGTPGVLTVLSGGNVNITGGGGFAVNVNGANAVNVQTGGTLNKTGAAGSISIAIPVNLVGGSIGATSGTLNLNAGGTSTGGSFNTTAPGIVAFNGGTHNLSGTYTSNGTGQTQVTAGTLNIAGTASLGSLTLMAGSIEGAGVMTITSGLDWQGGQMSGTGKTVLGSGSVSSINVSGFPILGRLMEVSGTVNLTNSGGGLYFGLGTPGVLTVLSGGNVNMTGGGGLALNAGGANAVNVQTGGTLTKTGAAGSISITIPLNLVGGTIGATSGVLNLNDGGTSTGGSFNTSASGTVAFNGGTHNLGGVYTSSGTGQIQVTTGTLSIAGTASFGSLTMIAGTLNVGGTANLGSLTLSSGLIQGTGVITITSALDWQGGEMNGTGKTVLGSGSVSSINVSGFPILGRLMEVSGIANLINNGPGLYFGSVGTPGVLTVLSGGNVNITGSGGMAVNFAGGNAVNVQSGGTLAKTGGGSTSIAIPVNLVGGSIGATSGTLNLNDGGTSAGGSFTTTTPGIVGFNGGTHNLSGNYTSSGTGQIQVTAGTLNLGGIFTSSGIVQTQVTAGTLNVAGTASLGSLKMTGGSIGGAGVMTVTSGLDWQGGEMSGTGKTVLASGSTSTISVSGTPVLGRLMEISGTVNVINSGSLYFGSGGTPGVLTVLSGGNFNITGPSGLAVNFAGANAVNVQTGGTLSKTSSATTTNIGIPLNNLGTVNVGLGTLGINGGFAGGSYNTATGFYILNGALTSSGAVQTNGAEVSIRTGGSAPALAGITRNTGKIDLRDGVDLTINPGFANGTFTHEGQIELSPGSVLMIQGTVKHAGTASPIYRSEIAGPAASQYGRVVATGPIDLLSPNSSLRFDPDLVGGYDPVSGTRFDIITGAPVTDDIDAFFGGTTPGGKVLLAGKDGTHVFAIVGAGAPPPAPQILGTNFEFETREAIVMTFNTDVSAFVSRRDYLLTNLSTNQPVSSDTGLLTYDSNALSATLLVTNLLPDANYRLSIQADDIANNAGQPLTTPLTYDFFILRGDANRDRKVDVADLGILATNWQQSPRTFSLGDFDYSGTVEVNDLGILASHWQQQLVAPSTPFRGIPTARSTRAFELLDPLLTVVA